MPKTTQTQAAQAASKRQPHKSISMEAIRALCMLKSDERLDAQRTLNKASDSFFKEAQTQDARHRDAAEAAEQAEADVAAHMDYLKPGGPVERGELSRKDYDREHRELQDAATVAKKVRDESRQAALEALAPYRKAVDEANKLIADLGRQWRFHEKRAQDAGVDISDLWTPSMPVPEDDGEA